MPDRDARSIAIAEAEWRVIAAECRLLLAMRNRAGVDGDCGPAPIGRLIDELAQAGARLRSVFGASALGQDGPDPAPDAALFDPDDHRGLAAPSNGSFTKPMQIGGR